MSSIQGNAREGQSTLFQPVLILVVFSLFALLMVPQVSSAFVPEISEYYVTSNFRSSSVLITNGHGVVSDRYAYRPQGGTTAPSNSVAPSFAGMKWDTPCLSYDQARYYDPCLSRFLSTDPGNQTSSPYLYAGDAPMQNIDFNGRTYVSIFGRVGSFVRRGFARPGFNTRPSRPYATQNDIPAISPDRQENFVKALDSSKVSLIKTHGDLISQYRADLDIPTVAQLLSKPEFMKQVAIRGVNVPPSLEGITWARDPITSYGRPLILVRDLGDDIATWQVANHELGHRMSGSWLDTQAPDFFKEGVNELGTRLNFGRPSGTYDDWVAIANDFRKRIGDRRYYELYYQANDDDHPAVQIALDHLRERGFIPDE
ncbi:MAG: hypothetical protein DHS20C01_25790 [marine bacterium B5-7]|nr:MAG: hypothetical protein DHS20C01_25790 [marine bacterium B5-7]